MKNLRKFMFLLLMVSTITLLSCNKDDDGGSGGDAASGTISTKVDGSQFTSLDITTFASLNSGGGQTTLIIQGNTASQGISFTVNGYNGVGTYEISDDNVFIVATYIEPNLNDPVNSKTWFAPFQDSGIVGELKIAEETDTSIKGKFSFTAKNVNDGTTKSITDGTFNVDKL